MNSANLPRYVLVLRMWGTEGLRLTLVLYVHLGLGRL